MALPKRPFHEDGDSSLGAPVQESKRRLTFKNSVRDVMRGLSFDEIVNGMEPFLRAVVREEIERLILPFLQSQRLQLDQIETSRGRSLQLHFVNKLTTTIFTGSRIESEDGSPIKIVLVDANTNTRITSGPLSSMKIEILVLDGEFGSDGQEDWTEQEFNASIVRERKGKRPLVTGDPNLTLREGVGYIGDVVFTDNSSWIRSRKFRLGATILQRVPGEVKIREARSEPFVVKDQRGELYKKHYPPSSGDEVWRLERIAKDGASHKRLADYKIHTVKDFLRSYVIDPTVLRNIIGGGISDRKLEIVIEHAKTCVLDDNELYTYSVAAQKIRLLFDSIYKVVGASFDDQPYQPVDNLTFPQKLTVEDLKRHAYRNLNNLVHIDARTITGPSRPLTSLQDEPFNVPNLSLQYLDFPITQQANQPEMQLSFDQSSASTSYNSGTDQLQLSVSSMNGHPMQVFSSALRNSFTTGHFFPIPCSNGENGWLPSGSQGLIVENDYISQPHISSSTWSPLPANWEQGNGLFFTSNNESEVGIFSSRPNFGVHVSRIGRPKAGWCKIRAALKMQSVWRYAVAKRMARLMYVDYN